MRSELVASPSTTLAPLEVRSGVRAALPLLAKPLVPPGLSLDLPFNVGDVSGSERRARRLLACLPPRQHLITAHRVAWEAIERPADEVTTRQMVAGLLRAIPSARSAVNEEYAEAAVELLIFDDEEYIVGRVCRHFTAIGLGVAFRRLLLSARFCPAISEIVQEARHARRELTSLEATLRLALERQAEAEEVFDKAITRKGDDATIPF